MRVSFGRGLAQAKPRFDGIHAADREQGAFDRPGQTVQIGLLFQGIHGNFEGQPTLAAFEAAQPVAVKRPCRARRRFEAAQRQQDSIAKRGHCLSVGARLSARLYSSSANRGE